MLEIGTTRGGRPVMLTDKERARHIHVLGAIGTGKSKLLEHMIRQDIARGRGLCLIDPHGTLADGVEQWCAMSGTGNFRRIHLMGGTQTKIVLGGLSDDDAEIMAREIMRGDIDLEMPKRGLDMPVVVDEEPFWLESESGGEGRTTSHSFTRSSATTDSAGTAASEAEQYAVLRDGSSEQNGMALSAGNFAGSAMTTGWSESEAYGTSWSRNWGRAQTLKPVREWRHTAYYSLDECLHLAQLKLRNLRDQTAIVKRRGQRTVQVSTIEVKPLLKSPPIIARFRQKMSSRSAFVAQWSVAKAEVDGRLARIANKNGRTAGNAESFWHEEP
jgi:hypothetical protein